MSVTVRRNFKSLAISPTTAPDMREIGLLVRERIIRRTRRGQGPEGPFPPLSESYAKQKQQALGTSAPDLTVSGRMLNDITLVDVTDNTVTLGWTS